MVHARIMRDMCIIPVHTFDQSVHTATEGTRGAFLAMDISKLYLPLPPPLRCNNCDFEIFVGAFNLRSATAIHRRRRALNPSLIRKLAGRSCREGTPQR